tara:strand:- start:1259 stop:2398 length:1140 start_codon:yes stop_codon:yes gene_type:complete
MQKNIFENFSIRYLNTKKYWRNVDKQILAGFTLLFILGVFFSFSSTSILADERLDREYYSFFQKHFLYAFVSFSLMIFISLLNNQLVNRIILPCFLLFLITLALVPLIGIEVKGAKRWLNLYFFNFQPIEFIKPFFILLASQIISSNRIKNLNFSHAISFLLLSVIIIFLVGQPDLGQSVLIFCTWLSLIFVSGMNIYFLVVLFITVILAFFSLITLAPEKFDYIVNRIASFLDPSKGDNFQSQKAIDAIRQGGIKGQGMGEGILKESVPEAHTDYIIAVISEEFGSIISILIISIFLFIAFRITKVIINSTNNFYKISLCGLVSLLIFQTFIHVGVNANLLPTTGMTLPFLSYGGSSLISSGIVAGIILNYTSLGVKN